MLIGDAAAIVLIAETSGAMRDGLCAIADGADCGGESMPETD